jgi:hypothetical protein
MRSVCSIVKLKSVCISFARDTLLASEFLSNRFPLTRENCECASVVKLVMYPDKPNNTQKQGFCSETKTPWISRHSFGFSTLRGS